MALAPLTGCLELYEQIGSSGEEHGITLSRVLTVDAGPEAFESGASDDEAWDTSLEVRPLTGSWDVAELSVGYVDLDDAEHEELLTEHTQDAVLEPGDTVSIPDVNLTRPAALLQNGEPIVTRQPDPVDQWEIGEAPVGFAADPDTTLAYDLRLSNAWELGVEGIATDGFELLEAREAVGLHANGTLQLVRQASPIEGPFGTGIPADLTTELTGSFPAEMSIAATVNDSEPGRAGLALEDTSFQSSHASTLWVTENGSLQGLEPGASSLTGDGSVIAWVDVPEELVPDPNATEQIPCFGATRADGCTPEVAEGTFPYEETTEPGEPIPVPEDAGEDMSDRELEIWRTFLGESLALGDRIEIRLSTGDQALPEPASSTADGTLTYTAEVVKRTTTETPAGTFETHELATSLELEANAAPRGIDANLEEPIRISETLQRSTFWFDRDSGTLVQYEQTSPASTQRVLDELIGAIDPGTANVTGPERVSASSDSRFELQLAELDGAVRMSPLFAFTMLQAGLPMGGFALGSAIAPSALPGGLGPGATAQPTEQPGYGEPYGSEDQERSRTEMSFDWSDTSTQGWIEITMVQGEPASYWNVTPYLRQAGDDRNSTTHVFDARDRDAAWYGEEPWSVGETKFLPCPEAGSWELVILDRFGDRLVDGAPVTCTTSYTEGSQA